MNVCTAFFIALVCVGFFRGANVFNGTHKSEYRIDIFLLIIITVLLVRGC